MKEPVYLYHLQVWALVRAGTPFDAALELTIQNMVDDYADKSTCLRTIASICQAFLGHDGVQFRNFYRAQARLRDAAGGSPAPEPEPDPVLDIEGAVRHTGKSKNWIYKHSHELTRIQNGKRGKLLFRRSVLDTYLKKHSTPGIPD